MNDCFRVTTGGNAGLVFTPETEEFQAGRHPEAALRFSPQHDLVVSSLHAQFTRIDGVWHVRDLDSRNGTWIRGQRISGSVPLRHGDTVRLGADGPVVLCDFPMTLQPAAAAAPASTTQTLRALVATQRVRLRLASAGLLAAVAVLAAALLLPGADEQERAAWDTDRRQMQAVIDSLLAAGTASSRSLAVAAVPPVDEAAGLRAALRESEGKLQRLEAQLSALQPGSGTAADVERELLSASMALQRQQHAATLDFPMIQKRNRSAVAMVWVEYTDGQVTRGTAFAVRPDGTMLTNRHLIEGQQGGQTPSRMAVRFADSDQAFPARVVSVSATWDMAAIAVENILGTVPTVTRLNTRSDTLPTGTPLAMIGFPLGGEPANASGGPLVARPMVSAGLLHAASLRTLELQGLGAAGGSGSPILDPSGDVAGMLYGGRGTGAAHVLLAVPASAMVVFLSQLR